MNLFLLGTMPMLKQKNAIPLRRAMDEMINWLRSQGDEEDGEEEEEEAEEDADEEK